MDLGARRERFRALHIQGCFLIPNPWDLGSARALQQLGFPALASTSAGFAFAQGLPDAADALALDDVLAHLAELVAAVEVPVSADFQAGYTDDAEDVAANVARCVRGCRSVPGLILILRLAAGLAVDPGILLDGLPVPQRTGGIGQAVAMIVESPGIRTATLAEKMELPTSYVLRLIRWLSGYGVISHYQGGWAVVRMDAPDGARVRSAPNRGVGRRVPTPS